MGDVIIKINLLNSDKNNKDVHHFRINTNKFEIHYKISNIQEGYYPNLGVTAREGIILLYKHPQKNQWTVIDAYHNGTVAYINLTPMISNNVEYEVLLYSPLLSDIDELIVSLPDDFTLEVIKENPRKFLICGGPTSFGIGCTTVSLMFSNILARRFDADNTNISHNSNDSLKKIYSAYPNYNLKKYDLGIIELNTLNQEKFPPNKLTELIHQINTNCDSLIGWYTDKDVEEVVNKTLKKEINNNVILIKNLSHIYNEENKEMCICNNTPNDAGNIFIFKELYSTICEVKKWNI